MNVSELFKGITDAGNDIDIKGIANNSSEVKPGYLFFAVKGTHADGNQFIEDAISRGASAVISENRYPERNGVLFIKVDSVHDALWKIAKRFYGDPSSKLKMTGITGTNGKTTTAYLIKSIYQAKGIPAGLLGTIEYIIGDRRIPAVLTTPDVLKINYYLSQMAENGCKACVMEVSSHALEQGRAEGIDFQTCIYTNIGRDHLDYHKNIDGYLEAKSRLFKNLDRDKWAVVNVDDPYSGYVIRNTQARLFGYGIDNVSNAGMDFKVRARSIKITPDGMRFSINASGINMSFPVETRLIGYHNIYNILAAAGAALSSGISVDAIKEGIYAVDNVPGRLEKIDAGQPFGVFVDFAHTPDALENVLYTMRGITGNRIILVFGCGGDRDREKRPLMGRIANRMADFSIVTSDNPRTEDPLQIISDIEKGFVSGNYKIIPDRKDAINEALEIAEEKDVVLIAGKGHENYQILKNTVIPFNDRDITQSLLKEKQYAGSVS